MGSVKSILSRRLFWVGIIYAGLLLWSGIYRFNLPEPGVPDSKKSALLPAVNGNTELDRKIRVTYKEVLPPKATEKIPAILIHGSPGSAGAFDGLTKEMTDRRIIAVDLPGFGDSETDIPDYSILAHAQYLRALMDKLEIEKAHFVGFSLGSGVILHLYEDAPERVESISMVAAIGLQEFELLGNYHANRIAHAAQVGFFWVLKELTPHFGIFDGTIMPYARNFYDTDQRPLKQILDRIEKPFQIIHGNEDPLVPVQGAREHARIVPQSEYHELDDNHFFVFMRPETIRGTLRDFWNRAENGKANKRTTADPERINRSKLPMENKILPAIGPTVFVFFLLLAFLAFLNEDFAFVLGGIFAAQGRFGLAFAIIACAFGSWLCVFLVTLAGRQFGKIKAKPAESENAFTYSLFRGRFFGFRFIEYFRAGWQRDQFWKRVVGFLLSGVITCAVLTSFAYFVSTWLAEFCVIDPNNTLSMSLVLPLFIVPGLIYRGYQRWYAG